MTIWKKAISVATSAALLASLLAATVAPATLASIATTSAGDVAQGTTSAGTATYLFTENTATALNANGTMTVTITPAAPGTGSVTWAGTPVLSAPDSLGASVTLLGNVMTIKVTGHDDNNVETISITGLKVKASSDASPGAVVATLSAGMIADAFVSLTATASGTLASITNPFLITVNTTSACGFEAHAAGATVGSQTGVIIHSVAGAVPGLQALELDTALTGSHLAGEAVTQTVTNCLTTTLASPAKVVTAAAFSYSSTPTVYPGENNSPAGNLTVTEPATPVGFLAKGTTLTFTIATAGVVFSRIPSASDNNAAMTWTASLSGDRKSVVVTITAASDAAAVITLSDITYDVATTAVSGSYVEVNLALSGGLIVTGNPATNAIIFRGISATAPTPTVYIGENNQATGLVTLTEASAGFFQSGTGSNNVLRVCDTGVNYDFTFAPWAKVTAGDLKLREGTTVSADNIVEGTQNGDCYQWTVWTASTAPSTIVIGNSTFATGPLINVHTTQAPGIVALNVYSGNSANFDQNRIAVVGFAVAAYRNQVAVTALGQPVIPAGAKSKAGAIQIAETANGQLKRWEALCFEIVPRGSIGSVQAKYDTYIQALTTADLPVVTASGGLVVSPVEFSDSDCSTQNGRGNFNPSAYFGSKAISFSFDVLQQSTGGTGKVVVDNINLVALADAVAGPVLFNVYGFGGNPTNLEFQATVSNAKIGVKSAIKISALSALGVPPNQGPASTSTKVAAANKFITWRFAGGSALAGKTVRIYVATKNAAGGYGPYVDLTGRVADANGNAWFSWRATNTWVSVRAYFAGDASYAPSWSNVTQGRWL